MISIEIPFAIAFVRCLCFAVFKCLLYSLAWAHTTLHTEHLNSILNTYICITFKFIISKFNNVWQMLLKMLLTFVKCYQQFGKWWLPLFWGFLFSESAFPCFGGMPQNGIGLCVVPKSGILIFGKCISLFWGHATDVFGPKRPKTPQNCMIIYAHVHFWDFLVLNLNILPFLGHATFCEFSQHTITWKYVRRNMLTKNEIYSLAKFGETLSFCYHFVII